MSKKIKEYTVSVVMAVYNGEKYLADTIESILNQTFDDFEFIIVNDGSTDNTSKILDHYKQQDDRIRIINNESNMGLTKSLNRGIWESNGKYIARMDVGDTCHPERFKKQVDFFEQNNNIYVVGTWGVFKDDQGNVVYTFKSPVDSQSIRKHALLGRVILHPSAMIRSKELKSIGGYNEKYYTNQDIELWLRMSKRWNLTNIPEILVTCGFHEKGLSVGKNNKQRINDIRLIIREVFSFNYSPIHLLKLPKALLILAIPNKLRTKIRVWNLKKLT